MAPHWKCGSGQPVAGSNPALSAISATSARGAGGRCLRWRLRVFARETTTCAARGPGAALAPTALAMRHVRLPNGVNAHDRRRARGLVVLAGQACYTAAEWAGEPTPREGRSRAPDPGMYDRSIERLRDLRPSRVQFGHDSQPWAA